MADSRIDSIKILIQEIEIEQAAMKKYIARSELMASTLKTIMEMYRLTGTKESRVADLDKKIAGLKLEDFTKKDEAWKI